MKKTTPIFSFLLLLTILLVSAPASAHFLWMDPIGIQGANVGDQVSVSVYLHAEQNDDLHAWSVSLGFDDTLMDGGELTFLNLAYGASTLTQTPADPDAWYQAGGSVKYSGESTIRDISRWDFLGFLDPQALTQGQDFLLFTATFQFNGGDFDGEDVWIEHIGADGWDFENAGQFTSLDIYTDNTKSLLLGDGGPDYGSNVPLPAAAYLMGSGLVALVGIRRKRRKAAL